MSKIILVTLPGLLLLLLTQSPSAIALCVRSSPSIDAGCDSCGVGIGLGRVNLSSAYLQPVGSPLGNSLFSLNTGVRYTDPNKVLYECDSSDAGHLYEMFATNGADRVGGFYDLGAQDGYPGYYATYFPYVALRLTHLNSGKVFSRHWQQYPITHYVTAHNKIQIRVRDFSLIRADLIRISQLPGAGRSNHCGYRADAPLFGMASPALNATYSCTQPNGYLLFKGPGIDAQEVGSDTAEAASLSSRVTGSWNAMAMGTAPISSLSWLPACVARNVTPQVYFPPISEHQLMAGQTTQAHFSITIECDSAATSGIKSGNTALGLQVAYQSYLAAQHLGLVNSAGGVRYLLSEGYGSDNTIATGVGIALTNSATGKTLNFLSPITGGNTPAQGEEAGWYPVLDGASNIGSTLPGSYRYTTWLTATLQRLPGQSITTGKVNAKAYVWVKIQ